MNKLIVYVASPLGFSKSTSAFLDQVTVALSESGFQVLNPWRGFDWSEWSSISHIDNGSERLNKFTEWNRNVGSRNEMDIRSCDAMLAILDGADVDSGTASEIGFAYSLGKFIVGYRGDIRRSGENEACKVNLQVQYWIEQSGGAIYDDIVQVMNVLAAYALGRRPSVTGAHHAN